MFPFSMFTMSKAKTLAWAVFCIGLFILLSSVNMGYLGFLFLPWGLILSCIAAYKFIRDRGIISQAEETNAQPRRLEAPAMTSKGSSRLFVPEPLDRR